MTELRAARRLTVILDEDDTWQHRPVFAEIVHRAHRAGLAGASVFRGVEGFGATGRVHTSRLLSLSDDLPVVIMIVDAPDRIDAFLPHLDELMGGGGIAIVEDVSVRYYGAGPD